jgi:hypothetical protein
MTQSKAPQLNTSYLCVFQNKPDFYAQKSDFNDFRRLGNYPGP